MTTDIVGPRGASNDSVRRDNLGSVLSLVHRSGGLSRSALTAATGLNRSTIAALVGELTDLGLVVEGDAEPTNRRGRPSPQVRPHPGPVAIAVNPELDAVTVGLVGLDARVEHRVRREVDHPVTPEEVTVIVAAIIDDLRGLLAARRIVGLGLAVPGLVRAGDGLVRWAPHLEWTDAPIARLVEEKTGIRALVGNDASLGALAEHLFGAGRGVDDLVYLNGGASGIGGGVIVEGRPLGGVGGYAGEFGQNRPGVTDSRDRLSPAGTLEDEVSRARLLVAAGLAGADEPHLRRVLLAASEGPIVDELARQRRVLSVAVSNAINVLGPALVLFGGFLATVRASDPEDLDRLVEAHTVRAAWEDVRLESAALGDDLLMIGAAELAFSALLADPAAVTAGDAH